MKQATFKKTSFVLALVMTMSAAVPAAPAQAAAKLNKSTAAVYAGRTITLKLKGTAKKVKWTSTKKAVAAVNQKGKVNAKKAGKAVIRAKAGKKTFSCRITVKAPFLNLTSADLEEGQSVKLILTGASSPSFRSTDTSVAAVDESGNVTAVSEGTAAVIVTGKFGTCRCEITVTAAEKENDTAENNSSTGDTSGSAQTQSPAQSTHQHNYVPHYSYDGSGNPIKDAYFCSDVTCPENRGYGTDDGWRGEKAPAWTGTGNENSSTGNSGSSGNTQTTQPPVTNPPADNGNNRDENSTGSSQTGNAENTGISDTQKPDETNPSDPSQTQQPAAHTHSWTIPIMSADGLTLEGYKCAGCGKTSHVHAWTEEAYKDHPTFGKVLYGYRCQCGEEIKSEDMEALTAANKEAAARIRAAWVSQNTQGLSDLEKARRASAMIQGWTYAVSPAYASGEITHQGVCFSGNETFARYCQEMGIRAEVFNAGDMINEPNHCMTYVWIDGEQLVTDATPDGGHLGGTFLTMEGLQLYSDWKCGDITFEEYEVQIAQYER